MLNITRRPQSQYNSHQDFNNRISSHEVEALSVDLIGSSLWVLSPDISGDLSISLHPLMPVLPAELLSRKKVEEEADQKTRDQADVDGKVEDRRPVIGV